MDVPTVYRYAGATDHEHAARVDGWHVGWQHQAFVTAYGPQPEPEVPARFADVRDHWQEGYVNARDEYDARWEDEEAYGHDWRQLEPVERD